MKDVEQFIKKYRKKYYGSKRLSKIYNTARKYVKLLGKENRRYTTLNNSGEIIDKFYSISHQAEKIASEFLKLKKDSELQGYISGLKKDYEDLEHYAKYYKYRRRLELQRDDGVGESFLERYGTEKTYFSEEEKTLNQWLNAFRNQEISQDELNEIINEFKKSNEKYLSQNRKKGFYK